MAAIDQKINLIGVPQVTQGLDQIVAKTQQATAAINQVGSGAGEGIGAAAAPVQVFNVALKNAETGMRATTEAGKGLSEAIHVLHPILAAAGVELGNLGQFARLSHGEIGLLAIAVGGTLVAAFASAEEKAASTQAKLSGLFGSQDQGAKAFEAVKKSAEDLNTTVEALAPAIQAATTALQRFQQTGQSGKFIALRPEDLPSGADFKVVTDAVSNFEKILRASGQTSEEATKEAAAFFAALQNGGKVTADMAKQLQNAAPGAVVLLSQALGKGAISAEAFIAEMQKLGASAPNVRQVIQALSQFGPQAEQAFDQKAVKSFRDEFNGLMDDLKKLFEEETGTKFSDALVNALKAIRDQIKQFKADLDGLKISFQQWDDFISNLPGIKAYNDALNAMNKLAEDAGKAIRGLLNLPTPTPPPPPISPTFGKEAPAAGQFGTPPGSVFAPTAGVAGTLPNAVFAPQAAEKAGQDAGTSFSKGFNDAAFGGPPPDNLADWVNGLKDQITSKAAQIGAEFNTSLSSSLGTLDFTSITDNFQDAMQDLENEAQSTWDRIKEIFSQSVPANFVPGTAGFASGGLVFGPGSTTSDSILARLSAGEFIMTAAATQRWGVNFLSALNNLRMPSFQSGTSAVPRFAGGGAVSTAPTAAVHLHFPGGASFATQASESVATSLRQYATKSRYISIGPKPSWY